MLKRFIFLFLLPLRIFAANGDIQYCTIRTDGWSCDLRIAGMTTNGTYRLGWGNGTNLTENAPKMVFSVTSKGYDTTGALTTQTRTVYGTHSVRFPYPSDAYQNDAAVGSDVVCRIALSDWIYPDCTNITVNLLSGVYSNSLNSASVSSLAVTNLSTASYPISVGNWTYPGWQYVTNSTMRLRMVGFDKFAQNGKPFAAVKFVATDQSGHTVTVTTNNMVFLSDLSDAIPVLEYVADIPTATFSETNLISCNFECYPWIGTNILKTATSTFPAQPSPYYGTITNYYDPNSRRPPVIAVVNNSTGNDTNGRATNGLAGVVGSVAEANPFLTMKAAMTAISATNNALWGHNDYSGGIIYLRTGTGSYSWFGGSATPGNTAYTWGEIKNHPSDSAGGISINTSASGTSTWGERIKISNIGVGASAASIFDVAASKKAALWFDNLTINHTANSGTQPLLQSAGASSTLNVYLTRCTVPAVYAGLKEFGAHVISINLVRGCNFNSFSNIVKAHVFIGNSKATTNRPIAQILTTALTSAEPVPYGQIIAFNKWLGIYDNATNGTMSGWANTQKLTNGCAYVQNVFEQLTGTGSYILLVGADGSTGDPINNVILWHNTFTGQRINLAYNDTGSSAYARYQWSIVNNAIEDWNIKTDIFTGSGGANGARVGNWPVLYGVGSSGNDNPEYVAGASGFQFEFPGLGSWQSSVGGATDTWFKFKDRKSYDNGGSPTAGLGDYHLTNPSPGNRNLLSRWVLPYDIEGKVRGSQSGPGAYANAAPNRSGQ